MGRCFDYDYDEHEDERAELAAEARAQRRYQNALLAHPDPRDPDHPGEFDANE